MLPHQGVKRTTSWPRRGTSVGLLQPNQKGDYDIPVPGITKFI